MTELKVSKSDILHWKSRNERLIPKLEEMIEASDFRLGHTPYVLTSLYRDSSIIAFLEADFTKYSIFLKKSISAFEMLIDMYAADTNSIKDGYLSHAFYLPLICAILTENESLLKSFCRKYSVVLELGYEPSYTEFTRSIYALAVGDLDRASKESKCARQRHVESFNGLIELVSCVSENNQSQMQSAWNLAVTEFRKYSHNHVQGMPESALFTEGLAILRLNALRNKAHFEPARSEYCAGIQ